MEIIILGVIAIVFVFVLPRVLKRKKKVTDDFTREPILNFPRDLSDRIEIDTKAFELDNGFRIVINLKER